IVDELHAASGAERPEIEAGIGKSADEALSLGAGLLLPGEIDHGLARRYHSRRSAHLAVEEARPLGRKRSDVTRFVGDGMGPKLDDDLSGARRLDEPIGTLHHLLERLRGRQAREHDIGLRADFGRRAGGYPSDLLEVGEGAAAIAQHAVAALDQVFGNRQSDLADTDEADRFHALILQYGVIRGLDPRIHLLTKTDGLPGHKRVYARLQRAMPGNDDKADRPTYSAVSYASSSDWSEKFTLIPSEPSITVHSRSSKLRSPWTTKGSASAISRAASTLGARTMVSPSPRVLPSASARGPEANSTPFFSRAIMYSRWRGKCSAIFSGAAPPLERTT